MSDTETQVLVIDLGTVTTKAALSDQKTCRYVCSTSDYITNISDNCTPRFTDKAGLTALIKSCIVEQYESIVTRDLNVLLINSMRSESEVRVLAEVCLEELGVAGVWVVCPAEVNTIYNSLEGHSVSVDVGEHETRVGAVVGYVVKEVEWFDVGGWHVAQRVKGCVEGEEGRNELWEKAGHMSGETVISQEEMRRCSDVVFKDEEVTGCVKRLLQKYPEIKQVIMSGAPTMVVNKEYIISALGLGPEVRVSCCPERNKATWLGGAVFGGIESNTKLFKADIGDLMTALTFSRKD